MMEKFYELKNDPPLQAAGVEIGARVIVELEGRVENRIVFRRYDELWRRYKEASVTCVHLAVMEGTLEDAPDFNVGEEMAEAVELVASTEHRPIRLAPEEHFFALCSYVEGIVDMGLANLLAASYWGEDVNPETLPFGFNAAMHQQVARCLGEVAPQAALYILENLWEELQDRVPPEWLQPRIKYIREMYGLDRLRRRAEQQRQKTLRDWCQAIYRRDWEVAYNIAQLECYSIIDQDTGKVLERNLVEGLPVGRPGHPVSPDGWVVRKDGWEIYHGECVPEISPGMGPVWLGNTEYWKDFPEPWKSKLTALWRIRDKERLAAIYKLLRFKDRGSEFLDSCLKQVKYWMYEEHPQYKVPLSPRQVAAILRVVV